MKVCIIYTLMMIAAFSCNQTDAPEKETFTKAEEDSIKSAAIKRVIRGLSDTAGLYLSPVKIIKTSLVAGEYSSRKNIRLVYKNVSHKRIAGIKFKWYGEDAFGEPADMGGPSGFGGIGGGIDDSGLNPGKTKTSTFPILSESGKKIVLAWSYEIAFDDGSKWSLK